MSILIHNSGSSSSGSIDLSDYNNSILSTEETTEGASLPYKDIYISYGNIPVDPTKMEFTEDEFIEICNNGDQSKMQLGAIINLTNIYCDTYEVIDINHDNTTDTVDIMASTQVATQVFGDYQEYFRSPIRTWINGTYLQAFSSNIQNLTKTMSVKSDYSTLQDKVKILSCTEVGYSSSITDIFVEGTRYPVFDQIDGLDKKRWRPAGSYGNSSRCWLRSHYTENSNHVWYVNYNGGVSRCNYDFTNGVLPVMRF